MNAAVWKRAAKRSRAVAREALALAWAWVQMNEQGRQMYESLKADRDRFVLANYKLIDRAITAEREMDRAHKELATIERWNGSLKEEREILLEMLRGTPPR